MKRLLALVPLFLGALAQGWNMATPYPPANFHTQNIQQFVKEVGEATGGRVRVTVHPGGSLFPHPQILPAVRNGQVQMGEVLMSLLANENPLFNLDSIPFVATSYEEAWRLYQAQRPEVEKWLAQRGVVFLYAVPWPPQALHQEAGELGPGPQGPALPRLQPGHGQAGGTPRHEPGPGGGRRYPPGLRHRHCGGHDHLPHHRGGQPGLGLRRYFYDVKAWIPKNMVVVGRRAFESLSPQDREALLQAAKRAEERGWKLSQEQETKAQQTLAQRGMQVVKPSPQLLADLKRAGQTMILDWQRQGGGHGDQGLPPVPGPMRLLEALYRLSEFLALLLGLFVLGVILAQVVGRLLGFVVPSALELAGFATAGLIFLGLAPTLRAGGHIRVGLASCGFPRGLGLGRSA